ncbi:MAG: hypothetical protein ACXABD_00755 [Candidatus Thorarchaeota archaeon]|jgi:hypothetical protein
MSASENMLIELGDVIQIVAPSNTQINDKIFMVDYIDEDIIKLVDVETLTGYSLNIRDGTLTDESITGINILDRPEVSGYAAQHGYTPGSWLDVYFSGDRPMVITGQVSDLDNDMIEIKTYPENKTIYIDFAYKGLPKDLPIEKIKVRSKPETLIQQEQENRLATIAEEDDALETPDVEETVEEEIKLQNIDDKLRALFKDVQNVVIGEDLGEIQEVVELSEDKQRFGIEAQTNNLLDDLLATIPAGDRTRAQLNSIHTMIERFKQLRSMFSEFDAYGNITKPIIHGAQYKPLVNELKDLSMKLYWLLPVAVNKRKVFDIEGEIADEVNDISSTSLAQLRIQEDEIINTYMSNAIPEGENKYTFLIQNLNQYLTPFTDPTYPENQITNINVQQDIPVVIDNQDDFYSSAASNNDIVRTRFIMQNYNKGITQLEISDKAGSSLATQSTVIVPGDRLSLKSILMLPEPVIRFSHINLPATDIMTKADYSRHFINYWKYLDEDAFVDSVNIDSFVTPNVEEFQEDEDSNELFRQIKEFVYTPSSAAPDDETERYSKFLNTIIPKTRILFNRFKKYIRDGLSIHKVVEVLEPFMVYYDDLTFKQYSEMSDFIQNEIVSFKKRFIAKNREFNALKLTRYRITRVKPSLIRIFNDAPELFQQIAEYYGIVPAGQDIRSTKQFAYNDAELIHIMLRKDSMRAYMSAVALMNINLHLDVDVDTLLEQSASDTAQNMAANMRSNTCNKFVLSKKYTSTQEMEIDNNNPLVYFDKEYDPTRYDILKEYENERGNMPADDFEPYLIGALQESAGLDPENARREAQAMIDGNRAIVDGDYALLEVLDDTGSVSRFYYKRVNNSWQQDNDIDPSVFADTNKMLCDTQLPCFEINKSCLDKSTATNEVQRNEIDSMMTAFEFQYNLSQQELNVYTREKLDRAIRMLPKLSKLNQFKTLRYNKQQLSLGADIAERNILVSPYASMRDIIMGQSDFVKKQNDIIRFKYSFTRGATSDEDQYWFYCIETQTKLLPTFVFTLAEAFANQQAANNLDEYKRALDKVCADRGTISEDGNTWVDKHSGYEIRTIEFDTDEGYEDTGYKMVSRDVMEKDAGDNVLVPQDPEKIVSEDTKFVHSIVRAMKDFLGIDISSKLDFISTHTIITLAEIVGSERAYNEKSAKMQKLKGKGLPPYRDMKNTVLVMLTLSYFVVAIQITIPSIRTRKTFPGCIKSFSGFPLQDGTDMSTVMYIACVANKIKKSSVEPWNALERHNEKTISKKIIDLINKHVLTNATIKEMMREKQAYLLIEEEEYIPIQHELSKWSNFLPPLMQLKLPTSKPLSSGFEETLAANIKQGSPNQVDDINAIRGKIIQFSMEIQKNIEKVVSSQDPILTNAAMEPFLANSCCNEEGNVSTIGYFEKREPEIVKDNKYVEKLSDFLSEIRFMRIAPFFLSNQDTRIIYPPLNDAFSEETIYKAFIAYCKYNNNLPLSEDLMRICSDKPASFDSNLDIKEKIKNLKEQGKVFDNESLTELMNVINGRNMVSIDMSETAKDPIQVLRDLLSEIDRKDNDVIPRDFLDKFTACLDTYDTSSSSDSGTVRDFKNYLAVQTTSLTESIVRDIKDKSTLPKSNVKVVTTFVETVMTWASTRKDDKSMSDEDSTLFNVSTFMKNILSDAISVFPNIILDEVSYKDIKIPRHWSLSERHQFDVKNIISSYYSSLKQFYGDKDLEPILSRIQIDGKDILELVKATILVSGIEEVSVSPLLDTELVGLLYNYYFATTVYQYTLLANSPQFLVQEQPIVATELESDRPDPILDQLEDFETDVVTQIDIVQGEDAMIKRKVVNLVSSMLGIFANTKRQINFNYDSIMERVLRAKEKEKESVTQRLKDMTDEAREIDTEFKRHKLGDWGKGLEKGLTQYVQDTYDQEREALDKRLLLERQLNTGNIVSDMNMDIYVMDMENQMMRDEDMDKEAYGMADDEGENGEERENDGF